MDSFMYLITMIEESWLYFDTAYGYTKSAGTNAHPRLCIKPERAQHITAYSKQLGKCYHSPYYLNHDVNRALAALADDEDLRIPPSALARELVEHLLPDGLDGISLLKLCTIEHAIDFAHQGTRYVVAAQSGLIKGIPYLYEHVAQMITVVRHAFENQKPTFTVACALSGANTIPIVQDLVAGAQTSTNREFLVESSRGVRTSQGKTLREAMDDLLLRAAEAHPTSSTPAEASARIEAAAPNTTDTASLPASSNTFESVMKEKVLEQLRKNPNGHASMPALYNQLSPFFSQQISSSLMSLEKDGLVIKKDSMHYAVIDKSPQTASGGSSAVQTSECAETHNSDTGVHSNAARSSAPLEQKSQNLTPTQTHSSREAASHQEPVNISPAAPPQPDAAKRQIEPQAVATPLLPEFAPFEFNTKAGAAYFLTVLGVTAPEICSILKIDQSQYHLLRNDGFDMASHPSRYDEPRRRDAALCNRLNTLRRSDKRLLIQFFTHKISYNPGSKRSKEECQHVEALDRIFDSLALHHEKKAPVAASLHHEVPHVDTSKPNVAPDNVPAIPIRKPQMLPCHPTYPMATLDEPACAPGGSVLPLCFWPYPFKRMDHRLLFCHLLGGGRYQIAKAFGISAQKYDTQLEKACFSTPLVKNATYRTKRFHYRVDLARVETDRAGHSGDPMAFAISLPRPVKSYLLHWLLGEDDREIAESMEMPAASIPSYRQQLTQLQIAWANKSNGQSEKPATQVTEHANGPTFKSDPAPLNTPSPATRAVGHVAQSLNASSRTSQATSVAASRTPTIKSRCPSRSTRPSSAHREALPISCELSNGLHRPAASSHGRAGNPP